MPPRIGRLPLRRQRRIVAPIASVAAALAFVGPAHAEDADDEVGYLDYVRSHGVPYSNLNPDGTLGSGYHTCALIREGMSPQRIIDSGRGISVIWTPTIVYAAQHFLCRETLTEADRAAEAEAQRAAEAERAAEAQRAAEAERAAEAQRAAEAEPQPSPAPTP